MKESDLQSIIDAIGHLEKITGGHLGSWKTYLRDANSIWQKCPYQIGERVMLVKTPVINAKESWGWLGAKHFLIQGATATVHQREFYDGRFIFGLYFDDETWIDHKGKKQPVDSPGMYMFGESWLAPAYYQALSCEAL